ncbi:MAG: restriction endonuclease subunit M [Muribaculaceae bacterium]|nr:restriction endonuclease subunit M [Muribaculaceae bacterium]
MLISVNGYDIIDSDPDILAMLLRDHTTQRNIFWGTNSYAELGDGYRCNDQISVEKVSGDNGGIVIPRAFKTIEQQRHRSREMAEVFTPAWICNKQNNLIDNAWFCQEGIFNTEVDGDDGKHSWIVNPNAITFPVGRTWRDYVNEDRLEITCGEAPYLVSRYDTVTGKEIPIEARIGFIDRKLRVVRENTKSSTEWLRAAQSAYQSIYGYDWQGDNIFLARKNLLMSFVDYYRDKFGKNPHKKSLLYIAYIISWNIWQMDGLKGVIPNSCGERRTVVADLFGETEAITQCEGCRTGNIRHHNGIYCLVKDWNAPKDKQKIRFIDLIK